MANDNKEMVARYIAAELHIPLEAVTETTRLPVGSALMVVSKVARYTHGRLRLYNADQATAGDIYRLIS